MQTFSKPQFAGLLRESRRVAKTTPGAEICGIIVDTGFHLSLVRIRNISRRVGGFVFSRSDVRRVVAAAKTLGQEVVGTFHSHPVGLPTPGKSDIANAVDGSVMLIFDCLGNRARLWSIQGDNATELRFKQITGRKTV